MEMKSLDRLESEIGSKVEDFLEKVLKLKYLRIPDSLYANVYHRYSKANGKTKREISKYMKDFPDYIIFRNNGHYCDALLLELKTKKGKLTPGQMALREVLNIHVAKSWWSAEKIILEWFNQK